MDSLPIRFVLVDTSHPGNIGAVARAMKNSALSDLVLVNPREFPHPDAIARAAGADDLLDRARVVADLPSALAGCGLVVATSAREDVPLVRQTELREGAALIVDEARRAPAGSGVAVIFGTERHGLSNQQLAWANLLLRIPANPQYTSLNIAMAAQLIGYEIFLSRRAAPGATVIPREVALADAQDMDRLYAHLQEVMDLVDFRDRTQSGTHLMTRIRRLLNRAEIDLNELNILRGFLTHVQDRRRTAGGGGKPR
jgi:TrmH family RNA methyltransferase